MPSNPWEKDQRFVQFLIHNEYVFPHPDGSFHLVMSSGIYLYMHQAFVAGRTADKKVKRHAPARLRRHTKQQPG